MGTIFWFCVGVATGVAFDEFFTRVWKYFKAKAVKAAADVSD